MKFRDENQYKNLHGIYKIAQKSKGLVYIGQTKMKFIKRYWHHVWKLNDGSHDNKHLQNAWNKYGKDDFEFEVVHVLDKNENMNEYEIMYISQYDSYNKGFNLTTGGEGKKDCPMSESAKKIVGEKNRKNNLGKKHSKETKQKMKQSSPRRKLTKDEAEKLRQTRIGSKHTEESKQKMKESHVGSNNVVSVINESQAFEIKKRLIDGERMINISNDLNVNYAVIKSILQCKVWNHVHVDGWDNFIIEYNNSKKKTIPDEKVREIRELLNEGYTAEQIANICNVGHSVVYGIKQNRTYKNVK